MNGVYTHIMFKFGSVSHDDNFVVDCLYQNCSVCRPAVRDRVGLLLLSASIQELLSVLRQVIVDVQSSVCWCCCRSSVVVAAVVAGSLSAISLSSFQRI